MTVAAISPRSGRRLTAAGRARREKLESIKRRRRMLAAGGALTIVFAAPLSVAAYMGVEASFPGIEAAKSFMAMMADRSPGTRTKGELTKTKQRAASDAPTQRALGKITKPAPPEEFVEAIAPSVPVIQELPPIALKDDIGPILLTPQPPGGGIIIPPQSPPPGGGGGGPNTPPTPPGQQPPPPPPPPAVPEPGTWATMLLGFGLTGWAMRRRRRRTPAAFDFG
jgi:hypothetical protein